MFGSPRSVSGLNHTGKATLVPFDLLQDVKTKTPIPVTISGASNVTFTVNASVTNPVKLWNGNDYISLRRNLAYTWTASTTNDVLHATTGAVTADQAPATGVWYYYVGITADGTVSIYPSTLEPKFVEGPYEHSAVGHAGTARTAFWNYVGFHVCTATTPAFEAMTKVGYTYSFAATSKATATTWAELDFSAVIPKHGPLGCTVGGHLETGADGTVTVGDTSSSTLGVKTVNVTSTTAADIVLFVPFDGIHTTANGKVWAQHVTAAGDVHVSRVNDIV